MVLSARRHRSAKPLSHAAKIMQTSYVPEDGGCRIVQTKLFHADGSRWRRVSRVLYVDPGEASRALFGRVAWYPWTPAN